MQREEAIRECLQDGFAEPPIRFGAGARLFATHPAAAVVAFVRLVVHLLYAAVHTIVPSDGPRSDKSRAWLRVARLWSIRASTRRQDLSLSDRAVP